jgi:hypothetical protein
MAEKIVPRERSKAQERVTGLERMARPKTEGKSECVGRKVSLVVMQKQKSARRGGI